MSALTEFVKSVESAKAQAKQPRMRVKRSHTLTLVEVAIDDAKRRASSGEWEGAKGSTLVGLYAMCHRMVYGIIPSELEEPSTFRQAAKMAATTMHELFVDDPAEVAAFIRWSWEVEKRKNTWAQSKSIDRRRLGWRAQFSRALQTDYRIGQKQKR